MEKILILGNGFVGKQLSKHFNVEIQKTRINSEEDFKKLYLEYFKDCLNTDKKIVINCIGFTGSPNIDACEKDEESKSKTWHSNVHVPLYIKNVLCQYENTMLLHIGSGCVFYGYKDGGWKEEDVTVPESYYSKSKLCADRYLSDYETWSDNVSCIARIRMPISHINDQRNLITKLIKYNKIIDVPNSVTFIEDLIRFCDHAIKNNLRGIYHVVNETPLSAKDVMDEYKKYKHEHSFDIISVEELDAITVAKRSNCILNIEKLKSTGFTMQDSLKLLEKTMNLFIKELDVKS